MTNQDANVDGAVTRWTKCPACTQTRATPFVSFPAVGFVRCTQCGSVYKQFEAQNLRAKDFYERDYFHGRRSGRDRRFEHRARKCANQIKLAMGVQPVSSVLDIGCSFGYVLEGARRLGLPAAGTDISQYAVEICQQRGYRAAVGSLDRLPFADGEFDLVVMKHVLEHTPTPLTALQEVRRVCHPNGLVMIMVPSLRYFKAWLMRRTYRYFRPDDLGQQHYFYSTAFSLKCLLEHAGYDVVVTSKAFRRPHGLPEPLESLRCAGLQLWQGSAVCLHMQREVFALARPTLPTLVA